MPTYRRAIILIDLMDRDDFEHCMRLHAELQQASPAQIWSHYAVIGAKRKPGLRITKKSHLVETYLLIQHLNARKLPYRLWYRNALFIYNDGLYRITRHGVVREDLSGTCFITLRDTWRHPFFGILAILAAQRGGKLAKPNPQTMYNTGCMNKFYALRELYPVRARYLHDIAIPYNLQRHHYPALLNFLKIQMGNEVVFKFDCMQEGRGVVFRDLGNPTALEEISPLLDRQGTVGNELFISPAHRITREFRCYFTRKERLRVFSVKERVNRTPVEELVDRDNIEIYKNIAVAWHEVKPASPEYGQVLATATDILGHLSYNAGCVEFAQTTAGKTVFFEVNQMAGPLPFAGEDVTLTSAFYAAIFDTILDPPV